MTVAGMYGSECQLEVCMAVYVSWRHVGDVCQSEACMEVNDSWRHVWQ